MTTDPFSDVEWHRAKDLTAVLLAYARIELKNAMSEAQDAVTDAHIAAERLEHARAQVQLWTECVESAMRCRTEWE